MKRCGLFLFMAGVLLGRAFGDESVDLQIVHRIKAEAFNNSLVMDHLFHLTDANGPRLTGSPGFQTAVDWAVGRIKEWGVDNARPETWGPFGRSWFYSRFEIHMSKPVFAPLHGAPMAWCEGTKDLGAGTITIRDTGGTDHLSFDAVGLPGFQFIQDPLDYGSRTHHSELDVYDHAEPGDLMQASAVLASFVYNAAMRENMLPRKPLPKPLPPKKETADARSN